MPAKKTPLATPTDTVVSKKSKSVEEPVVEPLVVEAKTTKATKTKDPKVATKTKEGKVEAVVAPVETAEVQNVVVVEADSTEASIMDNFSEFITHFQTMLTQFNTLKLELRNLERKTVKQLKIVQKINLKKLNKRTRAPSGFVKPAPISDELATFLGKPTGSEMARTDVTREINKYIRANNLQDKENGRKINPDKSLSDLLKIDTEITLTYFNLQRYMGPHFPKSAKSEAAAAAAVVAAAATA